MLPASAAFLDNIAKYDGAICVNDMAAVELMRQSRERGIGVPERLYVAGSGNSRLGQVVTPSLTTTTLDYFQLGVLAIDIWRLMQRYPDADRFQVSLPCELIIRKARHAFRLQTKRKVHMRSATLQSIWRLKAPAGVLTGWKAA